MVVNLYKKTKYLLISFFFLFSRTFFGQVVMTNKGIEITSSTSTNFYINGEYVNAVDANNNGGKIRNGGNIFISQDFINNGNNAVFTTNSGSVIFNGNQLQKISGNSITGFYKIKVDKVNSIVQLKKDILVKDTFHLIRGSVDLNGYDIDLSTNGYLKGETNSKRIYGSSGVIKAERNIKNPQIKENIAGLGLYMKSKDNFNKVSIFRGHTRQNYKGDTSIYRYYIFDPIMSGMVDSLRIDYFDNNEVIGEEKDFKAFISTNDGIDWRNKGGLINTDKDYLITSTISPPELGKVMITLFSVESFATCLPNDSNYISAVFLAASEIESGDSLHFIDLSYPKPNALTWSFGDGNISNFASPVHTYTIPKESEATEYEVRLTVNNKFCSDTRKKRIKVLPSSKGEEREQGVFSGISSFKLSPNPTIGLFSIDIEIESNVLLEIDLLDLQGKLIEKRNINIEDSRNYKEDFNMSNMASGMYILKLQVKDEVKTLKVVKM